MITHLKKAAVLTGLLLATATNASAQTVVARYLEFGVTATDNLQLTETDGDSDLAFTIKPSVELKFSGNRFGTVMVAEVEHFHFNDASEDITDPRLFLRTRGTLVDNLLYVDGTVTYSKLTPDSNFLRPTDANEPAIDAKGRIYVFREFGELAELYIGLNHNSFFEDTSESATSRENGVDFSIGKNPRFGGYLWSLGGYYSDDESVENAFENSSLYATLGGVISKTLYGEVLIGQESRKFTTDLDTLTPVNVEDGDSTTWNVGFTWTPSESTSITAGYGGRFFGEGPNLKVRHRALNSIITATFTRDVSRSVTSLNSISSLGNGADDSVLDPTTVNLDNTSLDSELSEPFVDNLFKLSYKLSGRRSDIIFDAAYSDQEQLGGGEQIKSLLGRIVFDRKLSELTQLRLQYDYQDSEATQRANRNYTESRFAVKFIWNFDRVDSSRDEEFAE